MNKFKITSALIVFCIAISSCEKDDICVDGNTPLLVIDFYDVNDTTLLKDVPSLVIIGFIEPDSLLAVIPNTTANSVSIPLRTSVTSTSFIISQRLTANDSINKDTITFSYTVKDKFVSRACGLVANYQNLEGVLKTGPDNWIKEIQIVNPIIENSASAHVKIFH